MTVWHLKMHKQIYTCGTCSSPTVIIYNATTTQMCLRCRVCWNQGQANKLIVLKKYQKILLKIDENKLFEKINIKRPKLNAIYLLDNNNTPYRVNIGNKTSRIIIGHLSCGAFKECMANIQSYKPFTAGNGIISQSLIIKKVL